MAKHDHAAIQQSFVATTPDDERSRHYTREWLAAEGNLERLLEVISGGQSLRRFCERERLTYSPVQRFLTSPDVEPRYREAQEQMAEHLMGEIERVSRLVEGELAMDPKTGKPLLDDDGNAIMVAGIDPKAAAVILDGLKWRITKLNQRRYSDRQVVEQHVVDHAQLQRQAIRELARRQRPAIEGEVVRPRLEHAPASAPLSASTVAPSELAALITKERKGP